MGSNILWTKEATDFMMAGLQWKANEFELRLKSPYPFLFIETPIVVDQGIQPPIPAP